MNTRFLLLSSELGEAQLNRSVFSRAVALVASVALVLLGILTAGPASATSSPSSGPVAGGTVVTVDGIEFIQVSAGGSHTLGLTSEGTVFAWGSNIYGQLGDGTTTDSAVPVQVLGVGGSGFLTGATSVAVGLNHSLVATSSGVYAWGNNGSGQLGNGTYTDSSVPVQVLGVGGSGYLTGVTSVASGFYHSLAVTSSGVFAWGYNAYGNLGDGTTANSTVPVQVLGVGGSGFLTGVTSIAGGQTHTVAVTSSGVFSWGSNQYGLLGDGTSTDSLVPVQVLGVGGSGLLTGITGVAAGENHTVAIAPSGVYAWGNNIFGQLGDGTTTASSVPVQVLGVGGSGFLTGATSVAVGLNHSLVATSSGVYAWGNNGSGQLGNGTYTHSSVPVQVLGVGGSGLLTGVTNVAADAYGSVAVTSSGVFAWGSNVRGQLGDGSVTDRNTPVLSAHFQPVSIVFGNQLGTSFSATGPSWFATSPSANAGTVLLIGTAQLFGGSTPGSPATVSWNAGTFTYEAALANTGSSNQLPLGLASAGAVLFGVVLLLGLRRVEKVQSSVPSSTS